MSSFFRVHRLAAIVVLAGAGAWIATGKFAAVGSEEARASDAQPVAAETAAGTSPAQAGPLKRTVAAIVPTFTDHAREIRISGSTGADKRAVLAARASGIVGTLAVAQGDHVAEGAVVMSLEGEDLAADVANATATLAQRTQELNVAQKLYDRGNYPELQLISARAAKAAAEAQLKQAEAARDRLDLRAPFGGVVDSVDVERGEWVQQGTAIATILSLNPIVVKSDVSELDVAEVHVGDRAKVRLVNGNAMEGRVRQVANEASATTRTFTIEVALPNPDGTIPSGMTAEVSLFARPVPAVTVPRSVITLSEKGQIGLRAVGADNLARFVPVAIIDDTEAGLIVSGVPADVRIITAGQDLVRDGEEVIVVDAAALGNGTQGTTGAAVQP